MTLRSAEAPSPATSQGSSTEGGRRSCPSRRPALVLSMQFNRSARRGSSLEGLWGARFIASHAHPPAAVAAMDGYALRSAAALHLPVKLKKIGTSKAGARFDGKVSVGGCVRIFTGAISPGGADATALEEDANEYGDVVKIIQVPEPGRHIRSAGSNYSVGQLCLAQDRLLTARDIGVIASCGYAHLLVRRKPASPSSRRATNRSILAGPRGLTRFSAQTARRLPLLLWRGAVSLSISA
jgi:hypothetical protein